MPSDFFIGKDLTAVMEVFLVPEVRGELLSPPSRDYVNIPTIEAFINTAVQSDFLHGRLTPRLVGVWNLRGSFAFPVEVTYRLSDSILANLKYVGIAGDFITGPGLFRDRDMLFFRLTYQLN